MSYKIDFTSNISEKNPWEKYELFLLKEETESFQPASKGSHRIYNLLSLSSKQARQQMIYRKTCSELFNKVRVSMSETKDKCS